MKIRIFSDMCNGAYRIVINTEDWSQGDLELMKQFGEPEVDIGGNVEYTFEDEEKTKALGTEFVRVLHGFPYARVFDSRDYGSSVTSEERRVSEAVTVGKAWKDMVAVAIQGKVRDLRTMSEPLPTEEVEEI